MGDVFFKTSDSNIWEATLHHQNDTTIEYYRRIFNHCGDPESFERNVISAIGGVSLRGKIERWTPELWMDFLASLDREWESYLDWHKRQKFLSQAIEREAYPRPIYFDHQQSTWLTEPWCHEPIMENSQVIPAPMEGASLCAVVQNRT